ncbi:membrane-bound lytic murein transglycosylase MltF [Halomonas elongata]|uniref:Membrane-bound lytic murein transglycosylase F n=1 Tax=Halomonas elongata (strain ATCC 33173 / DSM 2581 / NBRC 15536 / NCIMB 2198 / 1H9) TaxID=768066 RepID=E1V7Z2_HALED|nr:membrane-bound lytic murein transglycosylase MltF [Halomonas elongata]WBF19956.1 membrane-bound lytic murein transglycosylase MltF [Halomonas elongata]WPU49144.1 membrane-bound lytic murein transglycosylase MltF [Halomonas elongata DSM 2581]CBV41555.1 lytic murein transglycosylase MltF [Halomonas elongata DSM 2581]
MLASWFNHVRRRWRGYLTLCATLLLVLFPVLPSNEPGPHLQDVMQRDFISVHTRNTPTTYYEGRQGPTGFEYELMRRFADHLGVSLALNDDHNTTDVLGAVRQQGDMGAAALPLDPGREGVIFSRPIMPLQPLLVYRRGLPPPSSIEDLQGLEIGTLGGTGTDTVMRELQAEHPKLSWKESRDMEVASLLSQVANGDLDAAVVFEHQFRLNRLFFPEVEDGFRLGKPLSLAWAFPAGQGLGLVREANRFLADMQDNGLLQRLETRYFGRDNYLEYVGARTFISHAQKRLPDYAPLFRQSARDTGFDWKLLAAVGYQESHWNPEATSPTGVRGLMMLTRPTASDLGIEDRLDPAQSIEGGARYLRSLEQRLPESITGDDRLYMALAAYNVGLGHLYDARDITRQRGGDPDAWEDVRRSLPLLQESGWYEKTRHGYARGGEPVIYVRNIRRYHEILAYVDRSQEQFHPLNARLPEEASRETFDVIPPST